MVKEKTKSRSKLPRYFSVFCKQARLNFRFTYFWLLGSVLNIAAFRASETWEWALIAMFSLLPGLVAIGLVVNPVDKAFETIGLNFSGDYGLPHWLVDEKNPKSAEIIRINAAGYTAEDFKPYIGQLATRLRQPIREIRKPSASFPVLEVVLKRSDIPSVVRFDELPLPSLGKGEFFVGQSDDGLEKLSLTKMVHMLIAGQTGGGKTKFLKQFLATILVKNPHAHISLIDMKGGIDFHQFEGLSNFEIVSKFPDAMSTLEDVVRLYEARRDFLNAKKKENWADLTPKELLKEEGFKGRPIGPVLFVVDELAEMSEEATENTAAKEFQRNLSKLCRLSRVTGIHVVLGTQRPDKKILGMQSKDNLQTRICFSVPSVTASTLVIGDMSASTLGSHPGRAIYQLGTSKVIQAPLIENDQITKMVSQLAERQGQRGDDRKIHAPILKEVAHKEAEVRLT